MSEDKIVSEQKDPLDELFVDENELNNEMIKQILTPYLKLTSDGKILLLSDFDKLNNQKKMIIIMLAKKVLKIRLKIAEEITPKELQDLTRLGTGTVSPTLTGLIRDRLAENKDGKYSIPNYAVHKIKALFMGG